MFKLFDSSSSSSSSSSRNSYESYILPRVKNKFCGFKNIGYVVFHPPKVVDLVRVNSE